MLRHTGQEKVTPRHLVLHSLNEGNNEKLDTIARVFSISAAAADDDYDYDDKNNLSLI